MLKRTDKVDCIINGVKNCNRFDLDFWCFNLIVTSETNKGGVN